MSYDPLPRMVRKFLRYRMHLTLDLFRVLANKSLLNSVPTKFSKSELNNNYKTDSAF